MTKVIKCPTCQKLSAYDATNPSRPFCSDRCKLIDLGAWAKEEYKIPTQESDQLEADNDSDKDPE